MTPAGPYSVCEPHPWLPAWHDDCGGPACPPDHMPAVLEDACALIDRLAAISHEAAAWLDGHGIAHTDRPDVTGEF